MFIRDGDAGDKPRQSENDYLIAIFNEAYDKNPDIGWAVVMLTYYSICTGCITPGNRISTLADGMGYGEQYFTIRSTITPTHMAVSCRFQCGDTGRENITFRRLRLRAQPDPQRCA